MAKANAAEARWAPAGKRRIDRSTLLQWGIFATTVVLVAAPIVPIIYQSVIDRALYDTGQQFTFQNYIDLFTEASFGEVILNSFILAIATTLIAQTLGAVFAILVGRTDLPGRRIFGDILLWPLFISPLVLSFGWFILYGACRLRHPCSVQMASRLRAVEPVLDSPACRWSPASPRRRWPVLYCLASAALADPRWRMRRAAAAPARCGRCCRSPLPLLMPAIIYSAVLNFADRAGDAVDPADLRRAGRHQDSSRPSSTTRRSRRRGRTMASSAPRRCCCWLIVDAAGLAAEQAAAQPAALRQRRRQGEPAAPVPAGPLRWPAFVLAADLCRCLSSCRSIGGAGPARVGSFLSPLVPFWHDADAGAISTALLACRITRRGRSPTPIVDLADGRGHRHRCSSRMVALVVAPIASFRCRRPLEYVALFPRAHSGHHRRHRHPLRRCVRAAARLAAQLDLDPHHRLCRRATSRPASAPSRRR